MNSQFFEKEEMGQLIEEKCQFCWDGRIKRDVIPTFFDKANNLRLCHYCPWCGRELPQVQED